MALSFLDGAFGLTYQAIRILFYVWAAVNRLFPNVLAVFHGFRRFSANRASFLESAAPASRTFSDKSRSRAIIPGLKDTQNLVRGGARYALERPT
jgi:hypothetical protein